MPICEAHGHMNCRECFPQPATPLDRRCGHPHPTTGRTCQRIIRGEQPHDGHHSRHDSELGHMTWITLKCGCTTTIFAAGAVDEISCGQHTSDVMRKIFPAAES